MRFPAGKAVMGVSQVMSGFIECASAPAGKKPAGAGIYMRENEDDDPIPGLYATGNCSGGRYSTDYITPISGNSIGWAFTMGRIAGKHIAE
jgi:succinate dehydrogenase/fumarate reductase flavoprotein subunit